MSIKAIARELRANWDANEHAIHKRPPFAAHPFETQDRFWVVGSTMISVLNGAHGSRDWAEQWAAALNDPATHQPDLGRG